MNYFLKGLREGTKKFWFFAAWLGFGFVGVVDILAHGLGGSIFKLKVFYSFVIVTILGVISLIIYKAVSEQKNRQRARKETVKAAFFEPKAEEEIRRKIAKDAGFVTLCYECAHFNPEKLYCSRKMADERVKEISINDKKYCLYWCPH